MAAGSALLFGAPVASATGSRAAADATPGVRHIRYHRFADIFAWLCGEARGVIPTPFGLRILVPCGTREFADPTVKDAPTKLYDVGTWTSPWRTNGFGLTELISSWNADTPNGTWIEVNVRGHAEDGTLTDWFVLGRWCSNDPAQGGAIQRQSLDGQGTDYATVWTDTFHTYGDHTLTDFQLRVQLLRPHGTRLTPTVRFLGAVASALPDDATVPVSAFTLGREHILDVPSFSQELHVGQYPQWDNGGEAWCSPTSSSMVLAYWRRGPRKADLSWVDPSYVDPQVDYAARNCYDYVYEGCGNWPFNTAYTSRFGLEGFVTRLRSLAEAEPFIAAGIPVITSVSFKSSELSGAGYSTDGHLMVLVGFTKDGDPVMNDPASHLIADDKQVRVTYQREQFENTWVPHSGGTVYINHPPYVRLPRAPREANW
ncbi:peptidase C39 family protein [Flexivirga caeni]|nr:peptidase C39 family protein [Flexivirga caeni]